MFEWSAQVSGAAVKAGPTEQIAEGHVRICWNASRSLTGQQSISVRSGNTRRSRQTEGTGHCRGDIAGTVEQIGFETSIKIASLGFGGQLGQTKKNIEEPRYRAFKWLLLATRIRRLCLSASLRRWRVKPGGAPEDP